MADFKKKQFHTLTIIPARGGSKSILRKNIYPIAGKPLISYVITAAKKSHWGGSRIIISTDDEEIARVGREWGAEVPFMRPSELAEDKTPTIPVIEHALSWLECEEGEKPEYVLLLQPTDLFVKPEQIDTVFELMIEKGADSGITMVRSPRNFHPYHVREVANDGFLEFASPEMHYTHPTRQSDPPYYAFGNLYWFRRDAFLREKKIEAGKRVGFEIDPLSAHDINEPADIAFAEFLLKGKLV